MFTVQALNSISLAGLELFPTESYHIGTDVQQPDAIVVRSCPMFDLLIPESVLVVGRAGVGVNTIPVDALTERGIPVLNTPGANTNAVRELVIAGMLIASRNIYAAADYVRALTADTDKLLLQQIEKEKKRFSGTELLGKTLGVIGLGNIGVQVANAAAGLGMRILGYDPSITVKHAWQLSADVKHLNQLDDLLAQSDFVTIHVPLLPDTHHIINEKRLAHVKPGMVLLNFARHDIVDDNAVFTALNDRRLRAYVSDFPVLALKNHSSVIHLPHLGASTAEAEENCAMMIVRAVRAYLEDGTISNSVNFPFIDLPSNPDTYRLSFVHRNIPGMVAQISTNLASECINIVSLQNGSKGAIAYTLIDIDAAPEKSFLTSLADILGMIRVRRVR